MVDLRFTNQWKATRLRRVLALIAIAVFIIQVQVLGAPPASGPNVLVIGSTHTFSEGNEWGVVPEKAFNPSVIASELESILDGDPIINANATVVFEDIYTNKTMNTNVGDSGDLYSFRYHRYSLAQYFMWPEGQAARLANLRGEGGTVWDYIVIMEDPYLMANMPGIYAEGVTLLLSEIAKGSAQPVLLAQWPENSSSFTATQFNEVVYRVGNSAGVPVAPGGLAWDSLNPQDTSSQHPTPKGAYLAAATIYSTIYDRNASTSSYTYNDAIADHALSTVQDSRTATHYAGKYAGVTPFSMKYVSKRYITYNHTGSSSERGINDRLREAMNRSRVSYTLYGASSTWPAGVAPIDFNYGRGNDWFEDAKDYHVDPSLYDRSYGFPMQDQSATANTTMLYGIDKRHRDGTSYEDGTDLGIAYNMIRPGTRETSLPADVRCIPIRLMWTKIHQVDPTLEPHNPGDSWHMNSYLDHASGTFMYTLLSGRCPVDAEPDPSNTGAWNSWLGQKIGYETAWRMSHLTTRVPGFKVLPSATNALTINPSGTETMTVRFMFPPQDDVIVTITSSDTSVGIVGPQKLVFTPSNYNVAQPVRVVGVPGSPTSATVDIQFSTASGDEIYDGLSDSWKYTNNRAATSLTHVDNGTTNYSTPKNFPVTTNLGASGATSGNTSFAGPNHGTLSWSGSDVVYTPDADYVGPDGFAYCSINGSTVTTGYMDIDVIDGYPDGSVRAEATDSTATEEGTTTGTWSIIRQGSTASDLTVNFTFGGTATDGIDYNLSESSPITIPSGSSEVTITLIPVDDSVFGEHTETATLIIAPGSGYIPITSPATINIADNDNNSPVVNAGPDQSVSLEPGSTTPGLWYGTVPGNIDTTTPNPETTLITNVAAYTEDGIAGNTTEIYTGQIYDADGNISFTENIDDQTRIWIDGNPILTSSSWSDRVSTGNLMLSPGWHDIEIRISNGGGGSGPVSSPGIGFDPDGGTAWQTLVDPGDGSFLRVGTGPSVVVDLNGIVNDPEDTPATLWTLVSSTPSGLTVTFADATAIDTTATFTAAGTYLLRLTANDGYGEVYDECVITVSDPGVLPEITVTATDASAAEAGQDTGTWTITRSGDTTDPLTVSFTMGGTATEPDDYTIDVSSPVTIPANESSVTVTLTPVDDSLKEDAETASLIITADAAYTVGASEDITITDDDNIPPVVDAGVDQTVPLVQGQAPGWSFSQWTGDGDSGLSNAYTYTVAHCFGDNHGGSVTVNGVVFTESFNTSGTGWSVSGSKSNWNGDDNANLTGISEDLGEEFIYNGNPRTVTLTGLIVGQAYEVTFFSVAWETGSRAQTFTVVGGDSMFINQDAYDNNNGIKISCVYVASSTSQDFTITPDSNSTFHLYAMANRITSISEATATLNGDVSDADGDTPTTIWTVLSTDPAGLESTVTFDDASAIDTTATFTELGVYTLRLTADDGNGPVYDECVITVGTGGGPIADVDLPAGISLYGYTGESPVEAQAAFQTLIDNSQLSLVRWVNPTNGQIKELYYTTFPSAGWVNEIGDLTLGQGYVVKTTAACTLSISGSKSTVSVSLDLPAGYSIIGFNKEAPMDAQTAFQSLIDADKLELVRWVDPANGQIKELYYTTYPSAAWVNEIGDLTEGQGYIIKLNAAHTGFTLP